MDLSPFYYREKLRKVLFCFASSSTLVVAGSGWGPSFCWTAKKPIFFLYKGKHLGWGGVVVGWDGKWISSPLIGKGVLSK